MNAAAEQPVISVKGLTKRYGKRTVVDHFSLDVMRGQIYGFLAPRAGPSSSASAT
jgi:ABC-2 type transport system ATP-binding protein